MRALFTLMISPPWMRRTLFVGADVWKRILRSTGQVFALWWVLLNQAVMHFEPKIWVQGRATGTWEGVKVCRHMGQ